MDEGEREGGTDEDESLRPEELADVAPRGGVVSRRCAPSRGVRGGAGEVGGDLAPLQRLKRMREKEP